MLKFIDYYAVRDERKRIDNVFIAIFISVFAEEFIHIFMAEKLHGHAVAFMSLHADGEIRLAEAEHIIRRKRMAEFVSYDIDISACSVEICKDKRLFVFRKCSAVAAAPFSVTGFNIECFRIKHFLHELSDFGLHILIHTERSAEYFV